MQISASIKPRINADGSVTLLIVLDYQGRKQSSAIRVNRDTTLHDTEKQFDSALKSFKGFSLGVQAKIVK